MADSLRDTVLVVGASDQLRNVSWSSGVNSTGTYAHRYVDLMAPGDSMVVALAHDNHNGGDFLTHQGGTSVAAALTSGAVGLLVSFDSSLGAPTALHGAPELKRLILAGADSNTRPDESVRKIGAYRFLSMYKPLVLAARRRGAPLCGNRVWSVNGKVMAMRGDSTVRDTLFATGESGGYLKVMHGGHRIHFLGVTSFNDREFVFDGIHWTEAANPGTLPPAIPGGTANSELQLSHNGDSAVVVQAFQSGGVEQINVSLKSVATHLTRSLSSWTVSLADNSERLCRAQGAQFINDDFPPYSYHFGGYACYDSTGSTGSIETANAQAAYSPLGDRVIVTVNRKILQSTGVQAWQSCPWSHIDPVLGVETDQCRTVSYQETDESPLAYAVRTADGVRSQLPNLAAGTVFWRAVSEPGSELVLGSGAITSTYDIAPKLVNEFATWGQTNVTWQASNCRVEYRTLATGAVNWTVPTNDPCVADGLEGTGTFSPRRVASAGVY
jgi:hypothetical protein